MDLGELSGEYRGWTSGGESERTAAAISKLIRLGGGQSPGAWFGKAFSMTPGADVGEGYNLFRTEDGAVVRSHRFATTSGEALEDEREALLMIYAAYPNPFGRMDTVDAIRRLSSNLFVGVATCVRPDRTVAGPLLFLLEGPVGPAAGVDSPAEEPCRSPESRVDFAARDLCR